MCMQLFQKNAMQLITTLLCLQVVGLERIAIVIPAEAMNQFQSALTTCQSQHASGIIPVRTQPSLQQSQAPMHQSQTSLHQSQNSLHQSPNSLHQSPSSLHQSQNSLHQAALQQSHASLQQTQSLLQQSPKQQLPVAAPFSAPAPPLAAPLSLGHGLTQVKHPLPACGVGPMDPLPPVTYQPMWISPGA